MQQGTLGQRAVPDLSPPGPAQAAGWAANWTLSAAACGTAGPARVITSLGVFSFDAETGEMILSSAHPGVSVEDVQRETGWPLRCSEDFDETPSPTADEIALVRKYDPKGVWTS